MNRSDDGVRFRGQEAEKLLLALNRPALWTAHAPPARP